MQNDKAFRLTKHSSVNEHNLFVNLQNMFPQKKAETYRNVKCQCECSFEWLDQVLRHYSGVKFRLQLLVEQVESYAGS